MLTVLIHNDFDMTELISRFREYLEYDDVRFFSLVYCDNLLKAKKNQVSVRCRHFSIISDYFYLFTHKHFFGCTCMYQIPVLLVFIYWVFVLT